MRTKDWVEINCKRGCSYEERLPRERLPRKWRLQELERGEGICGSCGRQDIEFRLTIGSDSSPLERLAEAAE